MHALVFRCLLWLLAQEITLRCAAFLKNCAVGSQLDMLPYEGVLEAYPGKAPKLDGQLLKEWKQAFPNDTVQMYYMFTGTDATVCPALCVLVQKELHVHLAFPLPCGSWYRSHYMFIWPLHVHLALPGPIASACVKPL